MQSKQDSYGKVNITVKRWPRSCVYIYIFSERECRELVYIIVSPDPDPSFALVHVPPKCATYGTLSVQFYIILLIFSFHFARVIFGGS